MDVPTKRDFRRYFPFWESLKEGNDDVQFDGAPILASARRRALPDDEFVKFAIDTWNEARSVMRDNMLLLFEAMKMSAVFAGEQHRLQLLEKIAVFNGTELEDAVNQFGVTLASGADDNDNARSLALEKINAQVETFLEQLKVSEAKNIVAKSSIHSL